MSAVPVAPVTGRTPQQRLADLELVIAQHERSADGYTVAARRHLREAAALRRQAGVLRRRIAREATP